MLEVRGLSCGYGDMPVLHGVDLRLEEGGLAALVGPNGAGKSTLLRAIMGLIPAGGSVKWRGEELLGLRPEQVAGRGVALVPEGGRVFAEMTCRDNLLLGAYGRGGKAAISRGLEMVHGLFPRLLERSGQLAGTLSGGERQMLALGRALMSRPRLLLLDEPSLGLHPINAGLVFQALAEISRGGVSLLLVEQKVGRALGMAQYAYVLENGAIALEGPAPEILAAEHVRRFYLAL